MKIITTVVFIFSVLVFFGCARENGAKIPDGPLIPEGGSEEVGLPNPNSKYITASPLDFSQIQSLSKFRSCAGHDFSGSNFNGEKESDRSMKNYAYPIPQFQGTTDQVKVFAPFDGTISKVVLENEKEIASPGLGHVLEFSTPEDSNAYFSFDHIYFVRDFKMGDKVKAGELVGYAALRNKNHDFDLVLAGRNNQSFDSLFDHMTGEVLSEAAKYGLTPENTKWTKEYRDMHPCNYNFGGGNTFGRSGGDWVQLKR